ncbi:MAG: hypothetical protein AB8G96_08965 [Phycisphaerales bacterium]
MNWTLLAVALFLSFAADVSVAHVLSFKDVSPSFSLVLVVFLSLHAPRNAVPWIGWGAGILMDLLSPIPHGPMGVGPLIGPHALGWCFGSYLVMLVRTMLFKRQIHTVGAMTLMFAAAASLLAVFMLALHSMYEPVAVGWAEGGAIRELLRRLGGGLYSALIALVLGPVLTLTLPVWSFRQSMPRGLPRRA